MSLGMTNWEPCAQTSAVRWRAFSSVGLQPRIGRQSPAQFTVQVPPLHSQLAGSLVLCSPACDSPPAPPRSPPIHGTQTSGPLPPVALAPALPPLVVPHPPPRAVVPAFPPRLGATPRLGVPLAPPWLEVPPLPPRITAPLTPSSSLWPLRDDEVPPQASTASAAATTKGKNPTHRATSPRAPRGCLILDPLEV